MQLMDSDYESFEQWDRYAMKEARLLAAEMSNNSAAEYLVAEYMTDHKNLLNWAKNPEAIKLIDAVAQAEDSAVCYPNFEDILHCIQRAMKLHIETTL